MQKAAFLSLIAGLSIVSIPYLSQAGVLHGGVFLGAGVTVGKTKPQRGSSEGSFGGTVSGNVYGGSGNMLADNNMYMGVEGGARLGTRTNKVTADGTTTKFKQGTTYYVDFLPGFVLDNQKGLLYGVVGAGFSKFSIDESGNTNGSGSARRLGYRVGLGYAMALNDNFSAGMRYVYSGYAAASKLSGIRPNSSELTMGLTYTFGEAHPNGGFLE